MVRRLFRLRPLTVLPMALWVWRNRVHVADLMRFAMAAPQRFRGGERSTLLREARRHVANVARA